MICILCKHDKDSTLFNKEHVIPEAINGTVYITNVCIECNSKMGHFFDTEITNNWLIKTTMARLGIKDRNGNIPHPFSGVDIRTRKNAKVNIVSNENGKVVNIKTAPIVDVIKTEKALNISITSSDITQNELYDMVNKIRVRNGLSPLSKEEIQSTQSQTIEEISGFNYKASLNTDKLELCIVKIAFELAYKWIGVNYSTDNCERILSDQILDYINNKTYGYLEKLLFKSYLCSNLFEVHKHRA